MSLSAVVACFLVEAVLEAERVIESLTSQMIRVMVAALEAQVSGIPLLLSGKLARERPHSTPFLHPHCCLASEVE